MILQWVRDTKKTKYGKWDTGDRIDIKLHGVPYKVALAWKRKKYVREIRIKKEK